MADKELDGGRTARGGTHHALADGIYTFGIDADGVERAAACRLWVGDESWGYARSRAGEIEAHWKRRSAEAPAMFNGAIHLLHEGRREGDVYCGTLLRTDFKSYLHWREAGFPAAGVVDAFGSALIRSVEGHILLGRQRAGHINAGKAYLPGGFIDQRDVRADGTIDIDASILRELDEETGLTSADVTMAPGYLLTRCGPLLSIARTLVSPLPAEALRARVLAHIAADPDPELVDAVVIRSPADIAGADLHAYARRLLLWLLADPAAPHV